MLDLEITGVKLDKLSAVRWEQSQTVEIPCFTDVEVESELPARYCLIDCIRPGALCY